MMVAAVPRVARRHGPAHQRGLVRGMLLFVAGALAGANLLYFVWTRDAGAPRPTVDGASAAGASTAVSSTRPDSARPDMGDPPAGAADSLPSGRSMQPAQGKTVASRPAPTPAPTASSVAASAVPLEPLLLPVQGIAADQLRDTFADARAQGRSHEAIDIMAPAGTPVLAVADGTVEKLFTSDAGGLTVYQFEPSGRFAYYYAHLQRYAPGLAEQQALRRGDVIGYVGSTGNADAAAPHLHFAVFELGPERRWWQGTAINPYPLLRRP